MPSSAGSIPIGEWTHVLGTWESGGKAYIYFNGVLDTTVDNPNDGAIDTDGWVIGHDRAQANRFFDGSIDDVAVWDRALDASEAFALYEHGRYSINYDGATSFKQSSSPLYANGSTEITMSAWVRANSLGDNRGVITSYNSDDINRSYFGLLIGSSADGRPAQFRAQRQLVNALPGSFPVGQWAHIAGVWKAGVEQSLYIDGTRVAENPNPPAGAIDIESWITGRDRLIAGRFFQGEISEPMILSRALDSSEVKSLFAAGRTNFPATEGAFAHAGQIGTQTGTFEETSGVYTTSTRGNSVGGTSDSFMFASREHAGDGEVITKLESLNDAGTGGKMGLMFRDGRDAAAPFVGLWQYNDGRLSVRYRASAGVAGVTHTTLTNPLTLPLWLRLGRQGDSFIASYSADGEEWRRLAIASVDLAENLQVGIMHEADSTARRSIASFSDFRLGNSVSLLLDSDQDGLDDLWEEQFFGNLGQGGSGDPDGDGIANLFEYYHGTNPTLADRQLIEAAIASYASELLPFGSVWKYLDDGSNQGAPWRGANFDDASWASGLAPLGYNDAHIVTEVGFGNDPANKHITTYFRHHFYIQDLALLSDPELSIVRDDGVAVYLNGAALGRDNLPAIATFTTLAELAIGGVSETTPIAMPIAIGDLRDGWNTFAAEIHQAQADSSDLGFDLKLSAQLPPSIPVGQFLSASFERSKSVAGSLLEIAEGSSDLINWQPLTTSIAVIRDNGATETVLITDDQPFDGETRRYLRLRIELR